MVWLASPEFSNDSEFLWHAWWFHDRVLTPSYGKGIGAQLGRDAISLRRRYHYWAHRKIVTVRFEGCIEVARPAFPLMEANCSEWHSHRQAALQRVLAMLKDNLERNHFTGVGCPEKWVYDIVRHWCDLNKDGVPCEHEAEELSVLAARCFDGSHALRPTSPYRTMPKGKV